MRVLQLVLIFSPLLLLCVLITKPSLNYDEYLYEEVAGNSLDDMCTVFPSMDVDVMGQNIKDIQSVTQGDCCNECTTTTGCSAWTWRSDAGAVGTCWLKEKIGPLKASVGYTTGLLTSHARIQKRVKEVTTWYKVEATGTIVYMNPIQGQLTTEQKFALFDANVTASDAVPLNRKTDDPRFEKCKEKEYPPLEELPTISIVAPFHNEGWSMLLRSILTCIENTPNSKLMEIIVVDDFSNEFNPHHVNIHRLRKEVADLPIPVKVLRLEKRYGLMMARQTGANAATGELIAFLDSHVECNKGWYEPVAARIKEDRTRVIQPITDWIHQETFDYTINSDSAFSGYSWQLEHGWYSTPDRVKVAKREDPTYAAPNPALVGCVIIMEKNFFFEIGGFDLKMDIWGGENLDLAFRAWACGGSVELEPCSHIGHLFRKKWPYTFPGDRNTDILRNQKRSAVVWMDEYYKIFQAVYPHIEGIRTGDLTEMWKLRKTKCTKPFQQYLQEVWPESPGFPWLIKTLGHITNLEHKVCLDAMWQNQGSPWNATKCSYPYASQTLLFSDAGRIQFRDDCLTVLQKNGFPILKKCNHKDQYQHWERDHKFQQLKHKFFKTCLTVENGSGNDKILTMKECEANNFSQQWDARNDTIETEESINIPEFDSSGNLIKNRS